MVTGGHAWLPWGGGMHGCWGVCMVAGGVHGCGGVCVISGEGGMCGCWGACVVAGGRHAWLLGGGRA